MKTTLRLDHEPTPIGHVVRALLRIEAEPQAEPGRTPLDLAVVLDRSGSMHGAKLAAARDAAAGLVRRLRTEDRLAAVAYDDRVDTVAPLGTGDQQPDLSARILGIQSGGSTNLSGGWLRARELLERTPIEGRARTILLLTDGLANVGITDPQQLVGLCRAARSHGIRTTTIGFGEDYDERLLRSMAEAGGGEAYYIEQPDQAIAIFAHEFEDLASLAAQNISVLVRATGASLTAVHHTYPRTNSADGVRLDLGDLYAREPRSLLVEFFVDGTDTQPIAVGALTISADVIAADGSISRQEIRLPITFSPADGPSVDDEVRRELLLLESARAREEALAARERGDFQGAAMRLAEAAHALADAGLDDTELSLESEELRLMESKLAYGTFDAMDAKYMFQHAHDRGRGRVASKMDLIRRRKDRQEQ